MRLEIEIWQLSICRWYWVGGLADITRGGTVDRKEVQGSHSNIKNSEKEKKEFREKEGPAEETEKNVSGRKMHVLQI